MTRIRRIHLTLAVVVFAGAGGALAYGATLNGTSDADELRGTDLSDTLRGRGGDDVLRGLKGDDVLDGGPGGDRVYGSKGNDRIYGRGGNDRLWGGYGIDVIRGGAGNDRIHSTAHDRLRDTISCGPGRRDRALVRREDSVSRDCEAVERVTATDPGE